MVHPLSTCTLHQALETTTQDLQVPSHSLSASIDVHVKLPSFRPRDASRYPQELPAYPDIRALYAAAEGPQTSQKLVMRKRATSPYQIKLPHMSDRMTARRATSRVPDSEVTAPARTADPNARPASVSDATYASTKTPTTVGCAPSLDPTPEVFLPLLHVRTSPPVAVAHDNEGQMHLGTRFRGPTFIHPISWPLPTLDTWSEICEDLTRAMEVFTVLSDVAPAAFFVSASSSLVELPLPCSSQGQNLEREPATPASPWNSFVYPCFVA